MISIECTYRVSLNGKEYTGVIESSSYEACYMEICNKFNVEKFDSIEMNFNRKD